MLIYQAFLQLIYSKTYGFHDYLYYRLKRLRPYDILPLHEISTRFGTTKKEESRYQIK